MALYNFTPQGDKFASLFGNAVDGLFLDCQPIFIGGQTQIVSPVSVGFGAVIAAGSKLSHDIAPNKLAISHKSCDEMRDFDARLIFNPAKKIANTLAYIAQLRVLSLWYENIRIPLADDVERQYLYTAAQKRISNAIKERQKRLERFVDKLQQSLELHTEHGNDAQIADHQKALLLFQNGTTSDFERIASQIDFSAIRNALTEALVSGSTYPQAVQQLTKTITSSMKRTLRRLV